MYVFLFFMIRYLIRDSLTETFFKSIEPHKLWSMLINIYFYSFALSSLQVSYKSFEILDIWNIFLFLTIHFVNPS